MKGATEVYAIVRDVGKGGRGCPDHGENLCGVGTVGSAIWIGDVGYDTTNLGGGGLVVFHHRVYHRLTGCQSRRRKDGRWLYPPLAEGMEESVLQCQ